MEEQALERMSLVDGWFSRDEGGLLYRTAVKALAELPGNIIEIGSYKGRSTVVLGWAARASGEGRKVFAIDPHQGELTGRKVEPTWDDFVATVASSGAHEFIVPIRKRADQVEWKGPVALLFIDGVHDMENVSKDYARFVHFVPPGGYIAFHDYSNDDHPDVRRFVDERVRKGDVSVEEMPAVPGKESSLIVTRRNATLSVIIPTCGRPSLALTLSSVAAAGATKADQVIVVGDGPQPAAREIVSRYAKQLTITYLETPPTRMVGAAQRNIAVDKATRSHLVFIDDDDTYMPGALAMVRAEAQRHPDRILLFREVSSSPRHPWGIVWKEKKIELGNVGSQMIVVPNVKGRLGRWPDHRGSDYGFLRSTVDRVIARLH
jgi:predicted O-methyltransferase YrrM